MAGRKVLIIFVVAYIGGSMLTSFDSSRQAFFPFFDWDLYSEIKPAAVLYDLRIKLKEEPAFLISTEVQRDLDRVVLWQLAQRLGRILERPNFDKRDRRDFNRKRLDLKYQMVSRMSSSDIEKIELLKVTADRIQYAHFGKYKKREVLTEIKVD